jgi:hypothetical protein
MPDQVWHEELPENCPPDDATVPNGEPHYRVVRTIPPEETDFASQRALMPSKSFGASECRARAVSLFLKRQNCFALLKFPTFRGWQVVKLELPPESGVCKLTNPKTGHVAWWRRAGFDPIPLAAQTQ